MERFKQKLQAAAIPFRENEPLAAHCTFKIGGPAQLFDRLLFHALIPLAYRKRHLALTHITAEDRVAPVQ